VSRPGGSLLRELQRIPDPVTAALQENDDRKRIRFALKQLEPHIAAIQFVPCWPLMQYARDYTEQVGWPGMKRQIVEAWLRG
jgi:hypothetical protein